ncbi:MAG: hypothetical protein CR986_00040 [Ignavibacteriae bacterium]|nr:MAG: hypothetical protein CR986_00040 [Ignavibacteriota bacterium]
MKVQNINDKFRKFGEFQIKNRLLLIALSVIFAAAGIAGLQHLQPHNSRESWFMEDDQIEINTKKFEAQFGNNDNIMVLIKAKDVFDPEVLKMMKRLGNELLDSIPYADEITSLVDMEISVGTEDGIQVINPFEDGIPEDPAELERIRKLVLSRRALANKIVSDDCTETILMLSLNEFPPEVVWSKETTLDPIFQAGEPAVRIIAADRYKSDKYELKPVGLPYTETEERDFFQPEMKTRIGIIFMSMIFLLILMVRSFKGVIAPIFTIFVAGMSVFGFMGWLGIGYDQNMVMLPALLLIALSVAYSIHLINAFKRFFRQTGNRKEATILAVEETGWPLLFTAITTIGSVVSFATVGIPTITWVGMSCGAAVLANYLFVIVLLPIILSFGKNREVQPENSRKNRWLDNVLLSTGNWVVVNKKSILIIYALVVVALIPALFKVTVNMDMFKSMGRKVPYLNRVYEVAHSKLGSYLSYNVSIDFREQDAIKSPEVLKKLDVLVDSVSHFELTKKVKNNTSVFSILDIIKEMNQTLHSDSIKYYRVPDTREEIAQILLLYEMSGGTKSFNWIDEEYSMMRVQVPMYKFAAKGISDELSAVRRISKNLFPNATTTVVGSAAQFAEIAIKIVAGELKSVILSLIIISILLILVFASIKTGLIGLIPNLAPMLVIGAYLGYLDVSLNMMTMTVIPMMLGIAVDDTIHFINSIKYEFEKCENYKEATLTAFETVGRSLLMTTIVLAVSFATYILSPVKMIGEMGLLASIGLLAALITDFLITPALMIITKPFGKEAEVSIQKNR